jgi:hypothetical protein
VGFDLKGYALKFPEVCRRKFGRSYNLGALEKRFAPLRDGQRWLAAKDVAHIFHPDNTPFGKYWPQPNERDLDKSLSANHLTLGPIDGSRQNLVPKLLKVFHNVGVVSLVLRFVHPSYFGVFSTPVLHLVQVNRGTTVELYLAYCEELGQWAAHFGISSVAETEMALWSFAQTTQEFGTAKATAGAAKDFEDDLWVQRRRVAQVVRPFLRRYGRLQLAQILVDEDAKLAGKIAAEEYERLLGVASVKFCGRPLPKNKGSAERLIDELERKRKISLPEKTDLRGIWETRNAAVHPGEHPPTREAVDVMIDRILSICARWDRSEGGPR